jgi:hypothetical protein
LKVGDIGPSGLIAGVRIGKTNSLYVLDVLSEAVLLENSGLVVSLQTVLPVALVFLNYYSLNHVGVSLEFEFAAVVPHGYLDLYLIDGIAEKNYLLPHRLAVFRSYVLYVPVVLSIPILTFTRHITLASYPMGNSVIFFTLTKKSSM